MNGKGGSYTLNHERDAIERHEPLPKAAPATQEVEKPAEVVKAVPTVSHSAKPARSGKAGAPASLKSENDNAES